MSSFVFLLLLFFQILVGCNVQDKETTVYLVRHAEKVLTDTTDNPPLTPEGEMRAEQLIKEMGGIEFEKIFSTEYDRNINTIKPLANSQSIEISIYSWYDWHPVLNDIKKSSGKNYLICGHGDNLLPMIEYLGGDKPFDALDKHEYDNIFKVTLGAQKSDVEVIKY